MIVDFAPPVYGPVVHEERLSRRAWKHANTRAYTKMLIAAKTKHKQKLHHASGLYFQGNMGSCMSPIPSGNPRTRFMFCMAWPEAPFTRLSMTDTMMARPGMRSGKTFITQ